MGLWLVASGSHIQDAKPTTTSYVITRKGYSLLNKRAVRLKIRVKKQGNDYPLKGSRLYGVHRAFSPSSAQRQPPSR